MIVHPNTSVDWNWILSARQKETVVFLWIHRLSVNFTGCDCSRYTTCALKSLFRLCFGIWSSSEAHTHCSRQKRKSHDTHSLQKWRRDGHNKMLTYFSGGCQAQIKNWPVTKHVSLQSTGDTVVFANSSTKSKWQTSLVFLACVHLVTKDWFQAWAAFSLAAFS